MAARRPASGQQPGGELAACPQQGRDVLFGRGEELGAFQVSQALRHAPEVAQRPSEHRERTCLYGRDADLDGGPSSLLGGRDRVLVVSLPRLHQAHPGEGSCQLRADRPHAGGIDGSGVRLGGALAVWSGDAAVSEEFQQRTGAQWFGVRVHVGERLADQRDPAGIVTG